MPIPLLRFLVRRLVMLALHTPLQVISCTWWSNSVDTVCSVHAVMMLRDCPALPTGDRTPYWTFPAIKETVDNWWQVPRQLTFKDMIVKGGIRLLYVLVMPASRSIARSA